MSTVKVGVSKKNPYYLEIEREKELIHFCKQYKSWVMKLKNYDSIKTIPPSELERVQTFVHADPTYIAARDRETWIKKINMVDMAFEMTTDCKELIDALKEVIFDDLTYDKIRANHSVPCGRRQFYILRRRFLWNLHLLRE